MKEVETMIELTQAEEATYADVEETYPHRREYLGLGRRYDQMWEHSRTSDMRGRRAEIAQLCLRMAEISSGRGDQYRAAMWQRRAYLHLCGDEDRVYSGADALLWQAKMRRLLDRDALPEDRRRILAVVLASGGAGIPGEGVSMLTPLREAAIDGAA